MRRAVVLLSGGLDSAVALYAAKKEGFTCHCLVFDYGQRHHRELVSARKVASSAGCPSTVIRIKFPWKGSSLLDKNMGLARGRFSGHSKQENIPSTYVPGRNIVFLSFALSYAEAIGAKDIFIGAHAQDYSGYPDCRPGFFRAFARMARQGTKAGVQKKEIKIRAPLLYKTKARIIKLGRKLKVPFGLTWSCYRGGKRPCGVCDSCFYRAKGFKEAGLQDSALKKIM